MNLSYFISPPLLHLRYMLVNFEIHKSFLEGGKIALATRWILFMLYITILELV